MQMLSFLLFTVIVIAANVGLNKFMYAMIQEGNLLGAWQKPLNWFYNQNGVVEYIGRLLGNCEMCFYHLWSIIGFVFYVIMGNHLDIWAIKSYYNIVWYILYVTCVWFISLKIDKHEKEEKR